MVAITSEQMARMGGLAFEARLADFIRASYPEQCAALEAAQLRAAIAPQVARAARYGLHDERAVATFVNAAWLLGANFDERIPSLAQVLAAPELSAAAKTKALDDFCLATFHVLDSKRATPRAGA
jgi:hypothetical protein